MRQTGLVAKSPPLIEIGLTYLKIEIRQMSSLPYHWLRSCKQLPKVGWASSNLAPLPPLRSIVPKPERAIAHPTHPSFIPLFKNYITFFDKKSFSLQIIYYFTILDKHLGITRNYIFFSLCSLKIRTHLVISSNLRLTGDRLLHCSVTRCVPQRWPGETESGLPSIRSRRVGDSKKD